MPSAQQLEHGVRIGKYQLMRQLAVGGMGEVWVARNQATGAHVAVKVRRGDVANEEAALRFRHEARLGAMLSHRSIVRIFDLVEESDGTLLLVMELLRGETLERYARARGPLPTTEAIALALPVLSALGHAHDLRVVHRDVTPANIFLAMDPDGHVIPKLVDFGIAKLPASGFQTLDGRVLGTPRYMAPEQIRADNELDGRSDLFSMGVILYEMLTGSSPFAASSPSASLAAVLEAVVDPDPRVEPRVWIELQRALSKRAYERHKSAREMAEALRGASGVTEADLAAVLQRSLPSRDEATTDHPPFLPTPSVGGHSVGYTETLLARRGALTRWLVGGVIAACVALAATAAVRRTQKTSAFPARSLAETAAPLALAKSAGPSPLPTEPSIPAFSSASAPPSTAASNPDRATRVKHVKPVATTPGF
ncbi:MAG: serine/threonine protein kinase [Myxococcota bacterium]|nr:serine/threonine protein kinase [Myxococcota bacterium]